jgi:2-polyprenyl-3-methyl-5-hydroxy-6-metoxy-1,4-benzoquinol methylase
MPVFCEDGRALDIGCGNGRYLAVLKNLGWTVTGFDIEDHVAPVLKENGIHVFTGNLEVLSTLRGTYDLITMWHVLEHLHDPLKDLKTIRKFLSNRGSILIEVPNSNSPAAKLFRDDWYQWDLPRHLSHFTPQSLIQMLRESGFQIKELIHLRRSTLPLSLKYWIEKRKSFSYLTFLTHHERYCRVLRFFDLIYSFGRSGENILVAAE